MDKEEAGGGSQMWALSNEKPYRFDKTFLKYL